MTAPTKNPAAVALGSIRTVKKRIAAQNNGLKGGRPSGKPARYVFGPCEFTSKFAAIRAAKRQATAGYQVQITDLQTGKQVWP
jgi:hypothetical protein